MPGFGRFETVEQLASRGPVTVYLARPSGSEEEPTLIAKAYGGGVMMGGFDASWDEHAASFLESVLFQKKLADEGCKRWAPIIAADRNEDAAYYVRKQYPLTAQTLVEKPVPRDAASVAGIVRGVVDGLLELAAKDPERGHGNLKASNVLIETGGAGLAAAEVFLTDPASLEDLRADDESHGKTSDLKDLGRLLFRLVVRREPPQAGAIAMTAEWDRLSPGNKKAGAALRELCEQLLNPTAGQPLPLETVRERLRSLPSGGGGKKGVLIGGGLAAVIAVGAGAGAWFVMQPKPAPVVDPNGGNAPPLPPPVVEALKVEPLPMLAADWQKAERRDAAELLAAIDEAAVSRKAVPVVLRERLDAARAALAAADAGVGAAAEGVKWSLEEKVTEAEKAGQQAKIEAAGAAAVKLADVAGALEAIQADVLKIEVDVPPAIADQKLIDAATGTLNTAKETLAREIAAGGDAGREFERLGASLAKILQVQAQLVSAQTSTDREEWKTVERIRDDFVSSRAIARFQRDVEETTDRVAVAGDNMLRELAERLSGGTDAAFRDLPEGLRTALAGHLRRATKDERLKQNPEAGFTSLTRAEELVGMVDQWLALPAAMGGSVRIADENRIPRAAFDAVKQGAVEGAMGAAAASLASAPALGPPTDPALAAQIAEAKRPLEARLAAMQMLIDQAEAIDTKLKAGLMYAEKPAGQANSIAELVTSVRGLPEFAAVGASVGAILSDAALLAGVEKVPLGELAAVFPAEGGKDSLARLGAMRTAYGRLTASAEWPASLNDLDNVVKYAGVVKATAAAKPDGASVAAEADAGMRAAWVRFANGMTGTNRELIAGVFAPARMSGLGVGDAELAKLSNAAKFNRMWLGFEAKVSAVAGKSAAEQTTELMAVAGTFLGELDRAGLTEASLPRIADVRKALANARDGKGGADFLKSGPGLAGWSPSTTDPDASFVAYTKTVNGTSRSVGFVKVSDEAFIGTTEASVGLVADLVGESGLPKDEVPKLFAGIEKKDEGVAPWEIADGLIRIRAPEQTTGNGWFFADQNNQNVNMYPGPVPLAPSLQTPITRVSPAVAAAVAAWMGCRLPTLAEWSAAAGRDDGGVKNLRDQTYLAVYDQLSGQQVVDVLRRPDPARRIFRTAGEPKEKDTADRATAAMSDGVSWFLEVPNGAVDRVNGLIGNVAEYVVDGATAAALQRIAAQPGAALDKVNATATATKERLGFRAQVIGGSALSLPSQDVATPREIPATVGAAGAKNGYSDVGFRLAFSVEGGGSSGGEVARAFFNRQFVNANRFVDPR